MFFSEFLKIMFFLTFKARKRQKMVWAPNYLVKFIGTGPNPVFWAINHPYNIDLDTDSGPNRYGGDIVQKKTVSPI